MITRLEYYKVFNTLINYNTLSICQWSLLTEKLVLKQNSSAELKKLIFIWKN